MTIFVFKITSIQLTGFDLFGDEAQYWLWSKNLDFGYFSKPPLLPGIIALVCSVFGNSFFVIKMIAVLVYCVNSYVIFLISKKLYKNFELALLTATSFFLMPAVSVSSFLVSTDILLVLFWSLALLQTLIIKEKPTILNFILFNRRRSSIWNLKSYNIIKNSNCIIANADDVLDENLNDIIREEQEEIVKKIERFGTMYTTRIKSSILQSCC